MAAGVPAEPACPDVEHGGFKKLSSQSGVIYTLNRLGHLGLRGSESEEGGALAVSGDLTLGLTTLEGGWGGVEGCGRRDEVIL
ncbi:uncharacterized [Tachysurus ichikawai]